MKTKAVKAFNDFFWIILWFILKCICLFMFGYVAATGFTVDPAPNSAVRSEVLIPVLSRSGTGWEHKMRRNQNPVPQKASQRRNQEFLMETYLLTTQVGSCQIIFKRCMRHIFMYFLSKPDCLGLVFGSDLEI